MARNVLITGCSSGFGLLSALTFARRGDTVFATMRTPSKGVELEGIRDAEKLPITLLPLDVTDQRSIDRAVAEVEGKGGIDVLVNNAGYELLSPIEQAEDEEVRSQFDTNVFGVVRMVRAVAPAMRKRGSGTIINLSSVAGFVVPPYAGYYAATKHAVEAISEAMHYELSPLGIRVAIVEPGGFDTGFQDNRIRGQRFTEDSPYWERSERYRQAWAGMRQRNPSDPQQVADAVYEAAYTEQPRLRWLVGDDANLIATVRKQMDFEGFEATMRKTLDWWD
ncbi:MAG: SDR family oxidoreductase [Dehalococcoidia bacterium]